VLVGVCCLDTQSWHHWHRGCW